MAYVVRRPAGRWEIRESYSTPAGPRARTLVTFQTLIPEVIDRAARAAKTNFDARAVVRSAKRAGTPIAPSPADSRAIALVRSLARDEPIRPGLRRMLADRLSGRPVDDDLAEWIGASTTARGEALVDLLGLADRLPGPRRTPLRFPRLVPGNGAG